METLRPLAVIVVLTCSGVACDPSYTMHLDAQVRLKNRPVAGAWVVPVMFTRDARTTDAAGHVELSYSGFLNHFAFMTPVLVYSHGHAPLLVAPGTARFQVSKRFLSNTETDGELLVELHP